MDSPIVDRYNSLGHKTQLQWSYGKYVSNSKFPKRDRRIYVTAYVQTKTINIYTVFLF